MSLTSTYFLLFMILLVPIYYLVPKKLQWWVLLVFSIVFYLFSGWTNIFYVIFASMSAWISTSLMQKKTDEQKLYLKENKESLSKDEKKEYKNKVKKSRKVIMTVAVVLNVFVLCFFKFLNPINSALTEKNLDTINIIVPLGISYFTLQIIGYIVDVYWNNVEAEKNYFKVLLFTSFFPQMTQGPISDFKQLSAELFSEHELTYKNYSWGFQRLIWGFFKKLVIANLMQPYVSDLFENYAKYSGITLFIGMFVVMVQLYADFSGYMDIVCGFCEVLGIKLAENFNRPFFSKSLSEFWRRWHITLGLWFKKYVFFPVGTSKITTALSKKIKNKFGQEAGEKTISTVALLAIWFSIGVWHSVNLPFVLWGLLNGIIMIFSIWMEPVYTKTRNILHIKDDSKILQLFRMARTFTLVSALEVFSDIGSLIEFFNYSKAIIKNILIIPNSIWKLLHFVYDYRYFYVVVAGLLFEILFSVIKEKKDFRIYFNEVNWCIRCIIIAFIICVIFAVGFKGFNLNAGGFLYENF